MYVKLTNGRETFVSDFLINHLDIITKKIRRSNSDALIIIDGREGSGKTTLAALIADVLKNKYEFSYTPKNIFFDVDEFLKEAEKSKLSVFIWDEAALSGLSSQWFNKTQIKLLTFLMVARKKKNIYIFNIPRFNKLKEDIISRAICLINTYERGGIQKGYYNYYGGKGLSCLHNNWKRSRFVNYSKYAKFKSTFANVFDDLLTPEEVEEYEKKKDAIIHTLISDKQVKKELQNKQEKYLLKVNEDLRVKYARILLLHGYTKEKIKEMTGVSLTSQDRYVQLIENELKNKENSAETHIYMSPPVTPS